MAWPRAKPTTSRRKTAALFSLATHSAHIPKPSERQRSLLNFSTFLCVHDKLSSVVVSHCVIAVLQWAAINKEAVSSGVLVE